MSTTTTYRPAIAFAGVVASIALMSGAAQAGPAPTAKAVAGSEHAQGNVQDVRHRRWGGVGIYVGPGYGYYSGGYYPSYGYYDDGYYPRYRYRHSYYDDDGYRPYRRHSRRWAKERFEHPLGRR